MPKVSLYNMKGETVGELELNQEVFAVPYNEALIHQVMVSLRANQRQGNAKTKTRGEVSGGDRKPFRQKGTGMARQGSRRSPLMRGGAITFGPVVRSYTQAIPRKMRRLALRSALSQRVNESVLTALDALKIEEYKTKAFISVLDAIKVQPTEGRVLVVLKDADEKTLKSAANVPNVRVVEARNLNLLDVIDYPRLVATSDALKAIEEGLA
ncbi:TPA: 50S ribosomal protein L4 [bacterium UBP9_UBA11836]|nr:50S ribosomal protein L4 [bacterium UBP9_UBA11836]